MTADDTKSSLSLPRARTCSKLSDFAVTTCHLSFQDNGLVRGSLSPARLQAPHARPVVLA